MSSALDSVRQPFVLIVDDDPVIRLLAGQALGAMGMLVLETETGQEALEAVRNATPDLIILDVELPGRDGLEVCAELRSLPAGSEVPVLIMTGRDDSEVIERAFEVGATDFIGKPVDWKLLQHRVRFLMRAHGAFSELKNTLTALRDSESRLANAQRLAQIGNWEWVPGSDEMLWSEQVHHIFEIPQQSGASSLSAFLGVAHPDDREDLEKAMTSAASESRPLEIDHRIVLGDDHDRVVRQQLEITQGPSGEAHLVSGTIQDITDRHRAEEQIRYFAYYDDLTALPNRTMLTEQLERVLRRAEHAQEKVGLLFVDIDRFKRINDTLGHRFGDSVLKALADRLFDTVRSTDYAGRAQPPDATSLSRLGGDEFAVVLKQLGSSEDASHVSRRILEELRAPLVVEGQRLDLTGSIGIALYPEDGGDPETLLRNAGAALDQAKRLGQNGYQFFDQSMNERAIRNMHLESGLRAGIERGEMLLHYQPQIDARTGAIASVEALVRWRSIDHGFVSPVDFIGLAEESGLIIPLGEWVLRTACAQNRAWREAGLPPVRIAVNVSSHQVQAGGLVETVERTLQDTPLDPRFLEIEITESALIGDEPSVVETLERLHEMGIRLSLDDFGTGYSSLSHLVQFPIDTLKIDQSFVRELGVSRQADAITTAVVKMGHNLGLEVVAEGVETADQERFLLSLGCDTFQGYLYSRPIEADDLAELLRERASAARTADDPEPS
jgi:diguanylate cyclase (GGDEF)-like protein